MNTSFGVVGMEQILGPITDWAGFFWVWVLWASAGGALALGLLIEGWMAWRTKLKQAESK
jgi:hypothetical protein